MKMKDTKEKLIKVLIQCRLDCYVSKNEKYNPYIKSDLYDWHFEKIIGDLRFTDSYRGFNPYGGVEYVFVKGDSLPVWSCDYVGYVINQRTFNENEIYGFLKEARGKHLLECGGNLFSNYEYKLDNLFYKLLYQEKNNEVLEKVNIYYKDCLIAQHIASGKIRKELAKKKNLLWNISRNIAFPQRIVLK